MSAILRRSIAVATLVVAAPVLSSCGGNFDAPTDQVYQPGVGVNDRSGTVDVLHAAIVSEDNGSGTVIAGLVNQDLEQDDELVDVSAAGAVVDAGRAEIPAGELTQLADEGQYGVQGDIIVPGRIVELTFSFENAETITVEVPVVDRSGAFAEVPMPEATAGSDESPASE